MQFDSPRVRVRPLGRTAGAVAVLAMVLTAGLCFVKSAAAQTPSAFPDDWFFGGAERSPALRALEGKGSPGVNATSWIGEAVTLRDMRGKVVVLDFWATWCGPCVRAIPENVRLVNEHGADGLVFIGLHESGGGWEDAASMASTKGINYPLALDATGNESTVSRYGVSFFPTYVVIDRQGIVRAAGLLPNRVEDVVKTLLAEGADRSEVAGSDFSADHFYGGTSRPASLRAIEGRSAAALEGREWFGAAPPALDGGEGVSVLVFFEPESAMTGPEIEKVTAAAKRLEPAGAKVIGICDAGAGREKLAAFIESRKLAFPVLLDAAPAGSVDVGPPANPAPLFAHGTTASAFGARYLPVTVVVDGSGTVRAAGVRADRLNGVLEQIIREQDPEALSRIPAVPAPAAPPTSAPTAPGVDVPAPPAAPAAAPVAAPVLEPAPSVKPESPGASP